MPATCAAMTGTTPIRDDRHRLGRSPRPSFCANVAVMRSLAAVLVFGLSIVGPANSQSSPPSPKEYSAAAARAAAGCGPSNVVFHVKTDSKQHPCLSLNPARLWFISCSSRLRMAAPSAKAGSPAELESMRIGSAQTAAGLISFFQSIPVSTLPVRTGNRESRPIPGRSPQ